MNELVEYNRVPSGDGTSTDDSSSLSASLIAVSADAGFASAGLSSALGSPTVGSPALGTPRGSPRAQKPLPPSLAKAAASAAASSPLGTSALSAAPAAPCGPMVRLRLPAASPVADEAPNVPATVRCGGSMARAGGGGAGSGDGDCGGGSKEPSWAGEGRQGGGWGGGGGGGGMAGLCGAESGVEERELADRAFSQQRMPSWRRAGVCSNTSSMSTDATATCASVPVTRSCWHGSLAPGGAGRSSLSILMKAREVSRSRRMVAPPGPMSRRACSFGMARLTAEDAIGGDANPAPRSAVSPEEE
mmetsp:Transcript_4859/g.15515  ORF Transcript_4859/g.15515 Transcript_4859/m.15515 type:complete len:303 (+) Transcript_4859:70-978(+)